MIKDLISGHDYKDSLIILEWITKKDKGFLITETDYKLTDEEKNTFNKAMKLLTEGFPIQYITNEKEFMGLKFYVDENVLIPRFDTENLVEYILAEYDTGKILELGIGSGAISISLKYYNKNYDITGVEISEKALKIAEKNKNTHNVDVNFLLGDLYEPVNEKYNIIVSNPPYINKNAMKELDENVKYEPELALYGGVDGLDFYKKIIADAVKYLYNNGAVILEIGYDQGEDVTRILNENNFYDIEILKDLNRLDRIAIGKFKK